jgi:hypothetical protein
MGFFDFKLISILFLIVLFFIIYYEVIYLRSKVNYLTKCYSKFEKINSSTYKTDNIITPNCLVDFDNISDNIFDDIQTNNFNKDLYRDLNEKLDKRFDEDLDEELDEYLIEHLDENLIEHLDENLIEHLDENLIEHLDENLDLFNQINHNFLNNCLIKTINIPIDINNILGNFINNVEIIEIFPSNIVQRNIDIIDKNNLHVEIYSNDQSDREIVEENINQNGSNINQNNSDNNQNNSDNNQNNSDNNQNNSDINQNNSDNNKNDSGINQNNINIDQNNPINKISETSLNSQNNKYYENILKKIYKYKLPELQDISIKYKLSLHVNDKKKTKLELIEDIKNYINKNI